LYKRFFLHPGNHILFQDLLLLLGKYFFLDIPGFEGDLVSDVKSLFSSSKLRKVFLTVTAGGFSDLLILAASTPVTVD
jgi:hypothetical protein